MSYSDLEPWLLLAVTVFSVFIAYRQWRDKSKTMEVEKLASANNKILESWAETAKELREELGQCRKSEADLRIRMSSLETKLAVYRNVSQKGWPLAVLEEESEPDGE